MLRIALNTTVAAALLWSAGAVSVGIVLAEAVRDQADNLARSLAEVDRHVAHRAGR